MAVVTSANASANGLGFEGTELEAWEEAGAVFEDGEALTAVSDWFERMWRDSRPIEAPDIERAKAAWKRRQAAKPPLDSFVQANIDGQFFPLISWWHPDEWSMNPSLRSGRSKEQADLLEGRISEGHDIEGPEDRRALAPGRWILHFKRTHQGLPDRRVGLVWSQTGAILEKAFKYKAGKDFISVALPAEVPGLQPFPPREREFVEAFNHLIKTPKFAELRTDEYEGAWFTDRRVDLMQRFWRELRSTLVAQKRLKARAS